MKLFFKKFYLCLLLIIVATLYSKLSSQNVDFWKDLKNVSSSNEKIHFLKTDLVLKAYSSTLNSPVIDEKNAILVKTPRNVYLKMGDMETFNDKHYSLLVDHTEKSIRIMPAEKLYFKSFTGININELDTFIVVITKEENDSSKCYRVFLKEYSEINRIDFHISKSLNIINRFTIYYNKNSTSYVGENDSLVEYNKPILDITLTNIIISDKRPVKEVSYKDFCFRKRRKFTASDRFKDYIVDSSLYFNKH